MVLGALVELLPLGLGPQLPDRSAGFLVVLGKSLSPLGLNPGRAGPFVSAEARRSEHAAQASDERESALVRNNLIAHVLRRAGSKMAAESMLDEQHAPPDFACAALPAPAPKAGLDVCPDLSH